MRGSEHCPCTYEDKIGSDQLEPCPCIREAIETSAFSVDRTLNRGQRYMLMGRGERVMGHNGPCLSRCLSPFPPVISSHLIVVLGSSSLEQVKPRRAQSYNGSS